MAAVLNKQNESVKNFWFQGHRLAIAQQETLCGIQAERTELVQTLL
jgi:hypothetical protein